MMEHEGDGGGYSDYEEDAGARGGHEGATPGARKVLIIARMGPFYPEEDFCVTTVNGALRDLSVEVIDACQRGSLTAAAPRLLTENYSAVLTLGLGAADRSHDFLTNAAWKSGLVAFVARGGLLLMHGERYISSAFAWFGKVSWKADSYFRTTHSYCPANAAARSWYPTAASERSNFSVKACMLSGVAPAEQLFASTDSRGGGAAVALASHGAGHVGFFGDVNAEAEASTMRVIRALCCERPLVATSPRRLGPRARTAAAQSRRRGMMTLCKQCGERKSSSAFSKNQRRKPVAIRRCKACISGGRYACHKYKCTVHQASYLVVAT